MLMSRVIGVLLFLALFFGACSGHMAQVSQASVSGAKEAVSLLLSIGGTICLWSGLMEVMNRSGLSEKIARFLRPLIRLLFGKYGQDPQAGEAISQNMAANLLGLGSAATPAGLRAAARLNQLAEQYGEKSDAVSLLIVINTASLQLLPTTVAAVRAACGCDQPFDILPAVWMASSVSIVTGILAARLMKGVWRT